MSDDKFNVFDLKKHRDKASQRREKQTKYRNGASAHPYAPRGSRGSRGSGDLRWYHYLQFFLFLGLLAYFVQLCQH